MIRSYSSGAQGSGNIDNLKNQVEEVNYPLAIWLLSKYNIYQRWSGVSLLPMHVGHVYVHAIDMHKFNHAILLE